MRKRLYAARHLEKAARRRRIAVEPVPDSGSSESDSEVDLLDGRNRCPRCSFIVCLCANNATIAFSPLRSSFLVRADQDETLEIQQARAETTEPEGEDIDFDTTRSLSGNSLPGSRPSLALSNLRHSTPFNVSDIVRDVMRNRFPGPRSSTPNTQNAIRKLDGTPHQNVQTDEPSPGLREATPSTSQNLLEQNLAREARTLHSELLSILECPVCLDYIAPPISQCRRGHLVCLRCKAQLVLCPTCRERFSETRNLAMEKVAERLKFPCKNAAGGCHVHSLLADKDYHESNCDFRLYFCVFRPCEWSGPLRKYASHLRERHSSRLLTGERQVITFTLGCPTSFNTDWLVYCYDEHFRVNVFQNIPRCQLFALVEYIGPSSKASNFVYTLELERGPAETLTRKISYCRTTHKHVPRLSAIQAESDCLTLSVDVVNHFATNGEIILNLCIEKC